MVIKWRMALWAKDWELGVLPDCLLGPQKAQSKVPQALGVLDFIGPAVLYALFSLWFFQYFCLFFPGIS